MYSGSLAYTTKVYRTAIDRIATDQGWNYERICVAICKDYTKLWIGEHRVLTFDTLAEAYDFCSHHLNHNFLLEEERIIVETYVIDFAWIDVTNIEI